MLNKLRKNNEGFTIIEVMIVLAIAGLILLIVLLAVPALQRNSRNTTIKNDASTVAGAINTFESDNNGSSPKNVTGTGTVNLYTGTGPCAGTTAPAETAKVNGSTAVSCSTAVITAVGTGAGKVAVGAIAVWPGNTCPTAVGGSGQTSARAFAIFYATETSGNPNLQCVDS